jgi:histidinol-phosphate aminotransferase
MGLAAALAALDDDKFLAKTRKTNFQGLELFAKVLPTIGDGLDFVPSYANFILVKTGNGREVFKELQKRKIITRPMDGYGLPEWIRITIGKPAQNRKVLKALKDLKLSFTNEA